MNLNFTYNVLDNSSILPANIWSEWSEWSTCFNNKKKNIQANIYCFPKNQNVTNLIQSNSYSIGHRKRHRECLFMTGSQKMHLFDYKKRLLCGGNEIIQKEKCNCFNLSNPKLLQQYNNEHNLTKAISLELTKLNITNLRKNNNFSNYSLAANNNINYDLNSNCKCGCNLSYPIGVIYAGSNECKVFPVVWHLLLTKQNEDLDENYLIKLTIVKRQLNSHQNVESFKIFRAKQHNNSLVCFSVFFYF